MNGITKKIGITAFSLCLAVCAACAVFFAVQKTPSVSAAVSYGFPAGTFDNADLTIGSHSSVGVGTWGSYNDNTASGVWKREASGGVSGAALHLGVTNGSVNTWLATGFTVGPGKAYVVSFAAKWSNVTFVNNGWFRCGVKTNQEFTDDSALIIDFTSAETAADSTNGILKPNSSAGRPDCVTGTEWVHLSGSILNPSPDTTYYFYIATGISSGDIWLDNFAVEDTANGNGTVKDAVVTETFGYPYYISNGTFASGWVNEGHIVYDGSETHTADGSGSIRFDGTSYARIPIACKVGEKYTLRLWLKVSDDFSWIGLDAVVGIAPDNIKHTGYSVDENRGHFGNATATLQNARGQGWKEYAFSFTAAKSVTFFAMRAYGITGGHVWIDDFALYACDDTEIVVNGTFNTDISSWTGWTNDGLTETVENGRLHLLTKNQTFDDGTTISHHLNVSRYQVVYLKAGTYIFSANVEFVALDNAEGSCWHAIGLVEAPPGENVNFQNKVRETDWSLFYYLQCYAKNTGVLHFANKVEIPQDQYFAVGYCFWGAVDMNIYIDDISLTYHGNVTETTVDPSCTAAGTNTVSCACGKAVVGTVIAKGHRYSTSSGNYQYNWNTSSYENYTATLQYKCTQCQTWTAAQAVTTEKKRTRDPTCTETGTNGWTAKAVASPNYHDGISATSGNGTVTAANGTTTEILPALGHVLVSGFCDYSTVTCSAASPAVPGSWKFRKQCSRCGECFDNAYSLANGTELIRPGLATDGVNGWGDYHDGYSSLVIENGRVTFEVSNGDSHAKVWQAIPLVAGITYHFSITADMAFDLFGGDGAGSTWFYIGITNDENDVEYAKNTGGISLYSLGRNTGEPAVRGNRVQETFTYDCTATVSETVYLYAAFWGVENATVALSDISVKAASAYTDHTWTAGNQYICTYCDHLQSAFSGMDLSIGGVAADAGNGAYVLYCYLTLPEAFYSSDYTLQVFHIGNPVFSTSLDGKSGRLDGGTFEVGFNYAFFSKELDQKITFKVVKSDQHETLTHSAGVQDYCGLFFDQNAGNTAGCDLLKAMLNYAAVMNGNSVNSILPEGERTAYTSVTRENIAAKVGALTPAEPACDYGINHVELSESNGYSLLVYLQKNGSPQDFKIRNYTYDIVFDGVTYADGGYPKPLENGLFVLTLKNYSPRLFAKPVTVKITKAESEVSYSASVSAADYVLNLFDRGGGNVAQAQALFAFMQAIEYYEESFALDPERT